MKKFIPFLIVLSLTAITCKDEPTAPKENEPPAETLAEVNIGSDGGTLETDKFSLTIPEGALNSTTKISLYLEEDEEYFCDNMVSDIYKIGNIPSDYSKPLDVKIKYSGTLTNESFIYMCFQDYVEERGENRIVCEFLTATDSLGYLCCKIHPLEIKSSTISKKNFMYFIDFWLCDVSDMETHKSLYSQIVYESEYDKSKIEGLGSYFDEAVNFFHSIKLIDKGAFTSSDEYKLKIYLVDNRTIQFSSFDCISPYIEIPKATDDFTIASRFKKIIPFYKIDLKEIYYERADVYILKMMGGEGIYRFIRTLWLGSGEKSWFDWATIFWVKQKFIENKLWLEDFRNSPFIMQPFYGIETGYNNVPGEDYYILEQYTGDWGKASGHGAGMFPFIKYIMDNYNDNNELVKNIFEKIIESNSHNPIDALIEEIEVPEYTWWSNFFKEYLTGNLYNIPAGNFLKFIHSTDEIHFIDETDTVKTWERSYPDLSAKLCRINLSEQIKENVNLKFTIGPRSLNLDYFKALVFGVKDDQLNFINEGNDFEISELHEYTTLVVCVVNSANEPPYTGNQNINLQIRSENRIWNWPYVNIVIRNIEADVEEYSPYYDRYDTIKAWNLTFAHQPFKVLKNVNYFYSKKDSVYDWGTFQTHEIGSISITINESDYSVLSFEIHDSTISDNGIKINSYSVKGFGIPFYWKSESTLEQFLLSGVSSHITGLEWYYNENIGLSSEKIGRLLNITGDKIATIEIYWSSQPP